MDPRLHKQGPKGFKIKSRGPQATSALGHPDNEVRNVREGEITAQVAAVRARILTDYPSAQFNLQRPSRPLTEDEMDQIVEQACAALAEGGQEVAEADEEERYEGQEGQTPLGRVDNWRAAIDRIAYRPPGADR
ncbi:MAG: hypothetical protein ACYC4L_18015 [Chloroflexota bacterium]